MVHAIESSFLIKVSTSIFFYDLYSPISSYCKIGHWGPAGSFRALLQGLGYIL